MSSVHTFTLVVRVSAADKTERRESEGKGWHGGEVCPGRAEEHRAVREATEGGDGVERFGNREGKPYDVSQLAAI